MCLCLCSDIFVFSVAHTEGYSVTILLLTVSQLKWHQRQHLRTSILRDLFVFFCLLSTLNVDNKREYKSKTSVCSTFCVIVISHHHAQHHFSEWHGPEWFWTKPTTSKTQKCRPPWLCVGWGLAPAGPLLEHPSRTTSWTCTRCSSKTKTPQIQEFPKPLMILMPPLFSLQSLPPPFVWLVDLFYTLSILQPSGGWIV